MRILFFTDPHLCENKPVNRIDDFYNVQFGKLNQIWKLADKNKVDMIICGGDLFDRYSPLKNSFRFLNDCINNFKKPFYTVVGTHDIEGRNEKGVYDSALGTFELIKKVTILGDNKLAMLPTYPELITKKGEIVIRGIKYSDDFDKKAYIFGKEYSKRFKIIVTHNSIVPKKMKVPFDITFAENIKTNADLILCGHIHMPFECEIGKTTFLNPGTLIRQSTSESHIIPSVYIITISQKTITDITEVYLEYEQSVFNMSSRRDKKSDLDLDSFVTSLEKFKTLDLENYTYKMAKEMGINKKIVQCAIDKLNWARENVK